MGLGLSAISFRYNFFVWIFAESEPRNTRDAAPDWIPSSLRSSGWVSAHHALWDSGFRQCANIIGCKTIKVIFFFYKIRLGNLPIQSKMAEKRNHNGRKSHEISDTKAETAAAYPFSMQSHSKTLKVRLIIGIFKKRSKFGKSGNGGNRYEKRSIYRQSRAGWQPCMLALFLQFVA